LSANELLHPSVDRIEEKTPELPKGWGMLAVAILEQAQIDALFLDYWQSQPTKSSKYSNRFTYLAKCVPPMKFLRDKENAPRVFLETHGVPCHDVDRWVSRFDAGERTRKRISDDR